MDIDCLDALTDVQMSEWRDFLAQARHQHPRQDPRFAEVERAMGHPVMFATGRRDGRLCAVGIFVLQPNRLVLGRMAVASALSGPVCDSASDMIAFLQGLAGQDHLAKVDALRITPYWLEQEADDLAAALAQAGFRISDPKPHRDTGMIDLTLTEDDLRASFSRSARRKVRLVDKSDIEIRTATRFEEAETFFERLNTLVIARHNLTPIPRAEYEAGFRHVFNDPSIGVVFNAYHGDVFLGGLLLYRSGTTAHARRYVADPEAARDVGNLRVAPALWLEGMFWAKRAGCTRFDVEGFLPVEDKSHPNFNVYEYKREFKPTHVRRIAEHTLVLNAASHSANALPGQVKNELKRLFPQLRQLSPKRLLSARRR
ncbi:MULTISPECIES: GNAT family N-acetyltransferase [unclassified Ruegeria]|uniref:lipid II:glycine glycyltransferase FemX n=1 Tax=unclassified Ruegeria TaxID=2625375 RepID=UPI001AE76049|nr:MULTISPECIES: GNAT family N-acetyltransferase [unclassified Ruegeria]